MGAEDERKKEEDNKKMSIRGRKGNVLIDEKERGGE